MNLSEFERLERILPHDVSSTESPAAIGLFLYGLVRLARPGRVCEFGCYSGTTTAWLVRAVMENGSGTVTGYDVSNHSNADCEYRVKACCGDDAPFSLEIGDLNTSHDKISCDFAFIDHEPKTMYGHVLSRLEMPQDGIVALHDLTFAPTWREVSGLADWMIQCGKWDVLRLPWCRGLIVGRKR